MGITKKGGDSWFNTLKKQKDNPQDLHHSFQAQSVLNVVIAELCTVQQGRITFFRVMVAEKVAGNLTGTGILIQHQIPLHTTANQPNNSNTTRLTAIIHIQQK
ncbi:hypothetical protein Nepgr_014229 [Nepenthes gracilis]|uniref:Uncharacterized protein n=1 Tax=Nepenthes gracilis TaxID=150966 RepID=A0AAD3XPN4_NEPGR|nr:hypothetical protein Nepgr_014229 [Nepenthes gracilis]